MTTLKKLRSGSGDIFSSRKRSQIMSSIKAKNTKLEKSVFRELRKRGFRFATHYSNIVGKPDIAIPSRKKAVFIDSDFWHGWRYSSRPFPLKNEFWHKKLLLNRKRDVFVTRKLRRLGWNVFRIWEHQLKKDKSKALMRIEAFLKKRY